MTFDRKKQVLKAPVYGCITLLLLNTNIMLYQVIC